ncbi:hypothetical protein [Konateibacter massiliensis]|uniref:hypothetical protein n=1 Tax=Konateibacter massiliensis TaxID=2002841 RepID=UPI0015D4A2AB|nr:hypothetical protein [Konateibacter massiliensis]
MEKFMNEPIPYERTNKDIIQEYEKCQDKKKVAVIWGISVKEVDEILKQEKT